MAKRPDLTAVRALVWLRCRGVCDHCGLPLDEDRWELHHRRPGGAGGWANGLPEQHAASNLLALRPYCHNLAPDSVHGSPRQSYDAGWLISSHQRRPPSEMPVLLWGSRLVLLDTLGKVEHLPQP